MKDVCIVFGATFLLAATGCAHQEYLSGNETEAISQVDRWVPAGTGVTDAKRTMEKHGFICRLDYRGVTYLDCEYQSKGSLSSNPVVVRGHVSFPVIDEKVLAAEVTTSWVGP